MILFGIEAGDSRQIGHYVQAWGGFNNGTDSVDGDGTGSDVTVNTPGDRGHNIGCALYLNRIYGIGFANGGYKHKRNDFIIF